VPCKPQGRAVEHQQPEEKTEPGTESETDGKAGVCGRGLLVVKHVVEGSEHGPAVSTICVDVRDGWQAEEWLV
jgi:hypothetical protein